VEPKEMLMPFCESNAMPVLRRASRVSRPWLATRALAALVTSAALGLAGAGAAAAATPGSLARPVVARAVPGRGFAPSRIVVKPGARVFFRNADHLKHNAAGRGFRSGAPTTGNFSLIAPRRPGTYSFICQVHGFMQGVLVVRLAAG
jgi:plastocyanin